jgi:3-hydroxyacyl-CoA dehydrogenase
MMLTQDLTAGPGGIMTAHLEKRGSVALITLDNPPINGLNLASRQALIEHLESLINDDSVSSVVLTGAGGAFSGGADIKEFGSPKAFASPNLLDVVAYVEAYPKPVIAALHTVCMGGGVELALACHYRVAAPGCKVALPEVKLGLLPGAGGTQRLPRALGVEAALNLMVSGESIESDMLMAVPGQKFIQKMTLNKDGLIDEAVAYAQSVSAMRPLPQIRTLPNKHPLGDAYFQFARNMVGAVAKNYPAPKRCIDVIEAGTKKSFEEGQAEERKAFIELMWSPESRALRHIFMADRATQKIPDVPADTPTRKIESVAIIGAGTMGGGIAINFLNAGIPVKMVETKAEALERGFQNIRKVYEGRVAKKKLKPEQMQERLQRLEGTLDMQEIAHCDLVIEAVFEDMGVKEQVFKKLDAVMKPGAILASNTSTLDLNQIASFTKRPGDVVGMHFFSPANVMKLLEVVRGAQTSKEVLATVMALGKKIKKTCVLSGVCDGFIGNRMIGQYFRQAETLVDEGASPYQIDKAIESFGFPMGPFKMSDMAGNDIFWAIRKRQEAEMPHKKFSPVIHLIAEKKRFGQKVGAGYYDYVPGQRAPKESQEVLDMIEASREARDLSTRKISQQEIVQRLVFALVNEGARILEEGIASKAGDIDMVYLTGYGFPIWRGGPMCYADEVGLFNVVQSMKRFARNPKDDAEFWQPAQWLQNLVAQGKTLTGSSSF